MTWAFRVRGQSFSVSVSDVIGEISDVVGGSSDVVGESSDVGVSRTWAVFLGVG